MGPALLSGALRELERLGPAGPLAYVPVYLVASLLFVPNPVLIVAAGALFGLPLGFVLASVSSAISAGVLFWMGRHLSRGWVLKKIAKDEKIKLLDDAVSREGWRMVALLRLTAIVPFSVMNYGLGLSKIRFRDYILATWIGMAPGVLLYVYLGALAGEAALAAEADRPQKTPAEWGLFALALLSTVVMSVRATAIVKKALGSSAA